MGSLRKHLGTKYWIACFRDGAGRRVQRSTKSTDRKTALKLMAQWEDLSEKRATEGQARRVISDLHEIIHGKPLQFHTLVTYADKWLLVKKSDCKPSSVLAYAGAVKSFLAHVGDIKDESIAHVTKEHVDSWHRESRDKATGRTADSKLKCIRVLFADAWRDGLLADGGNPAAKIEVFGKRKNAASARRGFTPSELKAIYGVASGS